MPKRIPAPVKPEVLAWARTSARLNLSDAARKTKITEEQLSAWEKGDGSPTIPQLRKLGAAYKRPIAVFFLPEPPKDFSPQKEFRRLPGEAPGTESPELVQAIRKAYYQRAAAIELSEILSTPPHTIEEQLHPNLNQEQAGAYIRDSLGVSWENQINWPSPHAALAAWRTAIEAKGILVFQTGDAPLREMRGTCIPDQPFPIILINSKDAPHGRVFTLIHEYVHVLMHAAGHQTSRMEGMRSPEEQKLEIAANAFAAAALLPQTPFLKLAEKYPAANHGDDNALRLLSQRVKVSPEGVLRRLVTLRKSQQSTYRHKRDSWGNKVWYVKTGTGGAIPQHVKVLSRDGRGFARMVFDAYDRRLISTSAASDYLGTKPTHFANIRQELSVGPGSSR
ncbi:XRE family transcriptional regulator [Pelagicoccus sp. SDUM812005]|uniref:XRE family transcriptional regulator n=1 Tax=Pelagicoccus sp. SDUM812005 TaxID=3041257 RepID=UPI00280D3AD9|nr:XRE family transcriptional regulator [Pelagicoccus sp. SDUM812005]MDQ8182528.1 XRE family transcriptional regulator [Pelagicoccus sp. SDUM812005]